jgi:hypothetical protein
VTSRSRYSSRVTKPRPAYTGPARDGAWSGGAIIGTIMVILIVLAVIVYGVNTTANSPDTATSAPRTSGQGAATPEPSGVAR